jgi:hypothetical protein
MTNTKHMPSFGKLRAANIYHGYGDKGGTPYISDGDSARILFFVNLSGAYKGNARAEALNDMEIIAHRSNCHDELYNGCNALLGLIQLILNRGDITPELREALNTSHRIEEARAAIAKAEEK